MQLTRGTRVKLSVDEEGLHLRTDITLPPPREALRRTGRWLRSLWRSVEYSFFPIAMPALTTVTAGVVALVVQAPRDSWLRSGWLANVVWSLSKRMPWVPGVPLHVRVGLLAAQVALGGLFALAAAERVLLRRLLADKTYLYQARTPSLRVKLWFVMVRWLTRGRTWGAHLTYTFQSSLPKLPVPQLERSVEGYLATARLLQSPAEFAATEASAKAFLAGEGPVLQRYLKLKSWVSSNYVTDWWEKYVYLRGELS